MFEWEESRREQNIAQYGIDFVRAAQVFDNPVLEREDPRQFHGERRFYSLGHAGGIFIVVAWTPRGQRRRIVQAWKADRDDEAIYSALVPYAGPQDGGLHRGHGQSEGKLRPRLLAGSGATLPLRNRKLVRLRLDPEIADWFASRKEDPHAGINAVLRAYVERRRADGQKRA